MPEESDKNKEDQNLKNITPMKKSFVKVQQQQSFTNKHFKVMNNSNKQLQIIGKQNKIAGSRNVSPSSRREISPRSSPINEWGKYGEASTFIPSPNSNRNLKPQESGIFDQSTLNMNSDLPVTGEIRERPK